MSTLSLPNLHQQQPSAGSVALAGSLTEVSGTGEHHMVYKPDTTRSGACPSQYRETNQKLLNLVYIPSHSLPNTGTKSYSEHFI